MELKDAMLTHTRWVAIFESVTHGTFDDKNGDAVTESVLDNKLGDPYLSMDGDKWGKQWEGI